MCVGRLFSISLVSLWRRPFLGVQRKASLLPRACRSICTFFFGRKCRFFSRNASLDRKTGPGREDRFHPLFLEKMERGRTLLREMMGRLVATPGLFLRNRVTGVQEVHGCWATKENGGKGRPTGETRTRDGASSPLLATLHARTPTTHLASVIASWLLSHLTSRTVVSFGAFAHRR